MVTSRVYYSSDVLGCSSLSWNVGTEQIILMNNVCNLQQIFCEGDRQRCCQDPLVYSTLWGITFIAIIKMFDDVVKLNKMFKQCLTNNSKVNLLPKTNLLLHGNIIPHWNRWRGNYGNYIFKIWSKDLTQSKIHISHEQLHLNSY